MSQEPDAKPAAKRPLGPPIFAISLMVVSGGLCWWLYGPETVWHILT